MANPIPATGLGSNLDVNGLVTRLMEVEKQPLVKLDQKEAAVQLKISAYGTFKGAVSSFQSSLAALQNSGAYTTNKGTVDDANVASVSAGANADLGSHSLEVSNLAVAQRLKSEPYANLTDTIGTGKLTIQFGTYDDTTPPGTFTANSKKSVQNITIDSGHNTLAGVRDAINAAKAGVTASIVNDGSGFRLVLASNDTGTENSLKITATDDDNNPTDALGLSQLAYDPTLNAGMGKNLTQVIEPEDALFKLDGLDIKKASNTVTDVLAGTTLTLKKTNIGAPTTLSVTQDTSGVKTAVENFVKAYNELDSTVDKLTAYDAASKTGGTLQGDATVRSLMGQIRDGLSSVMKSAGGSYTALAQIGITVDRTGQLTLNSSKLNTALESNPLGVRGLFATGGHSKDSLINYVRSASSTPAGTYSLNLTQNATQSTAVGSAVANLTIDGTNDALSVTVNGKTASINLTQKTYTDAAALAAEVQTQLNGASGFVSGGVKVSVTESAGVLTLTSNAYGSESKIVLGGGSAQDGLFGVAPVITDGLDVAGTLGGAAAVGKGQELTSSNGLAISVAGGALGDRGDVYFTRGIAVALDSLLSKATGSKGTLSSATEGLQGDVKDIEKQRERLNIQLEAKEKRYLNQFNTLDGLITNMQSTMSYLAQQLSSLNNSTK